MKGRIIGREGRNIRAFEKATGVDIIVDDTPGVIEVTSFDPVKREVAKQAMNKLIHDGRIHPTRIEEVVLEIQGNMEKELVEIGKKGALDANVQGLNKKIIDLLGRLHFRTSYGQNVLRHSIEVAYLCQVMADELGLDGTGPRAACCTTLAAAVDHEVEGGHPAIGEEICRKFASGPKCSTPSPVIMAMSPRRALYAARRRGRHDQAARPCAGRVDGGTSSDWSSSKGSRPDSAA
jgi:ribonuclease Y